MTRPTRKKGLITRRVTCAGRRRETCRPSWTWWRPGRLTSARLVTHRFEIAQAPEAYELLTGKRPEKYLAILIEYSQPGASSRRLELRPPHPERTVTSPRPGKIRIGWIGAGSFSRAKLLPALRKLDNLEMIGLANATGVSASRVGKSFGFQYCTTDASEVLHDPNIDAVFIGTRHHLHGPMVLAALESGKHVFVEKPLCVNEQELDAISRLYARSDRILCAGFNRRFSPFARAVQGILQRRPRAAFFSLPDQCGAPAGGTLGAGS